MESKRVIAHFQPQAWINDNAAEIDGAYEFDVTDQIVAIGEDKALEIEDFHDGSDALWHAYVEENPSGDHDGPFAVRVKDSISAFFAE